MRWVTYTLWDRSLFIFYYMPDFFLFINSNCPYCSLYYLNVHMSIFFLYLSLNACSENFITYVLCIIYYVPKTWHISTRPLRERDPQTHKADNEVELRGITVGVGVLRMGWSLVVCAGLRMERSQRVFLKRCCLSWDLKDSSERLEPLGSEESLINVLTVTATIFASTNHFQDLGKKIWTVTRAPQRNTCVFVSTECILEGLLFHLFLAFSCLLC